MDRHLVESIINVLKNSSDKKVIFKGLLKLRSDLVKDFAGIELFRDCGGIQPIVRFLNKPHEQILEVALSILGNCCTDKTCCKEALEYKVNVPLATILKSILNPAIQSRACRLLGNLGKHDSASLLSIHCPSIAQTVCQILLDATDDSTRIMAMRACRFLLKNLQFLKYFLQSNGFTITLNLLYSIMHKEKKISSEDKKDTIYNEKKELVKGLKRNQHREKYFEEVASHLEGVGSDNFDHEVLNNTIRVREVYTMPEQKSILDFVDEILRSLFVMSELTISNIVWQYLMRNACSLDPIVFFASPENKYRTIALKILSNFSKNQGAFYILSSADAIVAACELLVADNLVTPLTENETRHCINIACMLSSDACNRSKIRRCGALGKLIAILRQSQSKTEISLILNLLNNFEYDSMSLQLMLREDLISVLIKQLNVYISSEDEFYKKKREEKQEERHKKRKLLHPSNETEHKCKVPKKRDDSTFLDLESPSSSPLSLRFSSSPCSSRSMSPISSTHIYLLNGAEESKSDDETYSPVCSDDEDENPSIVTDNTVNEHNDDGSDILKLLDIASRNENIEDTLLDKEEDEDTSQDKKLPQLVNLPRSTIDIIENLLFRLSLLTNKRRELGTAETMNTIIKAIHTFGCNNNFANCLTNILIQNQFFAQVISEGIPYKIYQLSKIAEMKKEALALLDTLTYVGESNYGKAELECMLNAEHSDGPKRAAITIGYIIKNKLILSQLLFDGDALTILLDIILCDNCDYTEEAVDALTSMCKYSLNINIRNESEGINTQNIQFDENAEFNINRPYDMRFIIHANDMEPANSESQNDFTIVEFNKSLLCETSEVFNTMLNSDFREGKEGEIHFHIYSQLGLKYFLNLICCDIKELTIDTLPSTKYFALLEAFEMSRVYIIPTMELLLQNMLIRQLDDTNCLNLFEWSIKNYHKGLAQIAVNYYLCSSLTPDAKSTLFRTAHVSKYSMEWLEMLLDTVYVNCKNGSEGVYNNFDFVKYSY